MRPTQISNRKPRDPKQRILFLLLLLAAVWGGKYFLVKHMYLPRLVLTQPTPALDSSMRWSDNSSVASVAISPDGKTIFSGGSFPFAHPIIQPSPKDIRTYNVNAPVPICVWDAQTGKLSRTFDGHRVTVEALACSHDGKLLASSGMDFTTRLWNCHTGLQIWKRSGLAFSLCFSQDDKHLAVGSQMLSTSSGQLEYSYNPMAQNLAETSFSPDGKIFACVNGNDLKTIVNLPGQPFSQKTVGEHAQLWDISKRRLLRTLPYNRTQAVLFTPDGVSLVCVSNLGSPDFPDRGSELHSINAQTGKENWKWPTDSDPSSGDKTFVSLAFSPNGKWLAAECFPQQILLLNAATGKLVRYLHPLEWNKNGGGFITPSGIGFSSDGKTLVERGRHTVQIWDTSTLF